MIVIYCLKFIKKSAQTDGLLFWQPQPDSNWCSRLERAVSWASRRWGQNCFRSKIYLLKRPAIIPGIFTSVKIKIPSQNIFYYFAATGSATTSAGWASAGCSAAGAVSAAGSTISTSWNTISLPSAFFNVKRPLSNS